MPKAKKVGRPKMPKGEAKGKIVPVRFEFDDFNLVTSAAKAANQTVSEWIRNTSRTGAEKYMFNNTLHKAMKDVLLRRGEFTATTTEISQEIQRNSSYTRKDGAAPKAQQINARVRQYPSLFEFVAPGIVRLVGN